MAAAGRAGWRRRSLAGINSDARRPSFQQRLMAGLNRNSWPSAGYGRAAGARPGGSGGRGPGSAGRAGARKRPCWPVPGRTACAGGWSCTGGGPWDRSSPAGGRIPAAGSGAGGRTGSGICPRGPRTGWNSWGRPCSGARGSGAWAPWRRRSGHPGCAASRRAAGRARGCGHRPCGRTGRWW